MRPGHVAKYLYPMSLIQVYRMGDPDDVWMNVIWLVLLQPYVRALLVVG